MASLNKVMLIGNLGADPELRYTSGGTAVCDLRLATNEVWTDKAGERKEQTEWHRVVVWGKQAEHCGQYLSKGRQVYVEGRLQTKQWDDKEGNKRYTTEIVAQSVRFLSAGRGEGQARPPSGTGSGSDRLPGRAEPPNGGDMPQMEESAPSGFGEEDIPF